MKKLIILIGIITMLIAARLCFSQNQEGVITYQVKVNLHRTLPPDRQEMKAMIPEFRTTKQQLFFNATESLYKPLVEDDDDAPAEGGGVQIRINIPNNEMYFDRNTGKVVSKQEFMGKDYLINDSLKMSPWKFGTDAKTILGYNCKQAFYTDQAQPDRKQEITVWYTEQIRPFLGPERLNTLPGAVLAVDINNGERTTIAIRIEDRPLKKGELKIPASGQKITQEEFRKAVDEQMKKMGGHGGVIIRN